MNAQGICLLFTNIEYRKYLSTAYFFVGTDRMR